MLPNNYTLDVVQQKNGKNFLSHFALYTDLKNLSELNGPFSQLVSRKIA
jgi:hypothetical protein